METLPADEFTNSCSQTKMMVDYSEYLVSINNLMRQIHAAGMVGNYHEAMIRAQAVARYAESLAAILETKTEMEI